MHLKIVILELISFAIGMASLYCVCCNAVLLAGWLLFAVVVVQGIAIYAENRMIAAEHIDPIKSIRDWK